jgi:hypothetical protein
MKSIRSLITAIAFATCFSAPVWSASYSADQSDLWWIPAESGWGIQFVQRNSTIFATMFVYDAQGAPTWYVATMNASKMTWTGDLYATKGPWFGTVPFDPKAVNATKVGTMTWLSSDVNAGTLTYTVNGTQVTKELQRQFIATDDFTGHYAGNLHRIYSNCPVLSQNGTTDIPAVAVIEAAPNGIAIGVADFNLTACTYMGTLAQAGQMARVDGNVHCLDNSNGNVSITELEVNPLGVSFRFKVDFGASACTLSGWFGGGRGTTF